MTRLPQDIPEGMVRPPAPPGPPAIGHMAHCAHWAAHPCSCGAVVTRTEAEARDKRRIAVTKDICIAAVRNVLSLPADHPGFEPSLNALEALCSESRALRAKIGGGA